MTFLCACAHESATATPKPAVPAPSIAHATDAKHTLPAATGRIEDYMFDHYVIVTFSRDAVIAGTVEGVREPLRAFASHDYADVAGTSWFPWIAQLQEQAKLTASSATLDLAASGVATMARTCGECHRANGRHSHIETVGSEAQPSPLETTALQRRMDQHMRAADLLWDGLVGPSDEAWQAGAKALSHISTQAPAARPPLPPDFVSALLQVRELGVQAEEATTLAERANIYGLLLASCADCHAQHLDYEF